MAFLSQPYGLDDSQIDGSVPTALHVQRQLRSFAFDEFHLSAIDGRPEFLASDGPDPGSDPAGIHKEIFNVGPERSRTQEVYLDSAFLFDSLCQSRKYRPGAAHQGVARGRDHHPVPEKLGRLFSSHDLVEGFPMFDPLIDVAHLPHPIRFLTDVRSLELYRPLKILLHTRA